MLTLHNSFTKQKEIFKPQTPGQVKLYVCGITVYDYCHIGHARTLMVFDMVYRYLKHQGMQVTYVRNITDIDDKIIKRAQEKEVTTQALTEEYIAAMHEDFNALGMLPPDHEPKATETIDEMIPFISSLIEKDFAYLADNQEVYFDVAAYKDYGQLSHQDLEALHTGARVEVASEKKSPLDFVLWKPAKQGEPAWDSPWGKGRPGWHIECSCMAIGQLGETLDIHGGGHDLIFPHHENERAQSECHTGKPFVNLWMHAGFINVDEEKMSKSLGNFFTIREVLKKYDAEVIRYFLMASHYRSPVNYSEDNLNQAKQALMRLYTPLRGLTLLPETEASDTYKQQFVAAMDDDFNTPVALSVLFDLVSQINALRDKDAAAAGALGSALLQLGQVLGLLGQSPEAFFHDTDCDEATINALIAKRNKARK